MHHYFYVRNSKVGTDWCGTSENLRQETIPLTLLWRRVGRKQAPENTLEPPPVFRCSHHRHANRSWYDLAFHDSSNWSKRDTQTTKWVTDCAQGVCAAKSRTPGHGIKHTMFFTAQCRLQNTEKNVAQLTAPVSLLTASAVAMVAGYSGIVFVDIALAPAVGTVLRLRSQNFANPCPRSLAVTICLLGGKKPEAFLTVFKVRISSEILHSPVPWRFALNYT